MVTGDWVQKDVVDQPDKGDIEIQKVGPDNTTPIAGAVFEVYDNSNRGIVVSGSASPYAYVGEGTATQLTTDANGKIRVNGLPGGPLFCYLIRSRSLILSCSNACCRISRILSA